MEGGLGDFGEGVGNWGWGCGRGFGMGLGEVGVDGSWSCLVSSDDVDMIASRIELRSSTVEKSTNSPSPDF